MAAPRVGECHVTDCAFNRSEACHAFAVTISDAPNRARCDTFLNAAWPGGSDTEVAYVGACKVLTCRHNRKLGCAAKSVTIGYADCEPDCLTYARK